VLLSWQVHEPSGFHCTLIFIFSRSMSPTLQIWLWATIAAEGTLSDPTLPNNCEEDSNSADEEVLLQMTNHRHRSSGETEEVNSAAHYIGCFVDDGNRDLQEGPRSYGYNSVSCLAACVDYSFFALQNNGWCVCGNAYSTEQQYAQVSDAQCGANCADDDQLCGAGWRNAVYSIGSQPEEQQVNSAAQYIGCFVDDGNRDLQEGPRSYGYNSVSCLAACVDYSFFALQNNGWCVCGNAYSTEQQYAQVSNAQCGANCADDDQLCGAGWRNAVYSIGSQPEEEPAEDPEDPDQEDPEEPYYYYY